MNVDEEPVLSVDAQRGELKVTWIDAAWKNWHELQDAEEFKALVKTGNSALKIAKELRAKGRGKGKPYP